MSKAKKRRQRTRALMWRISDSGRHFSEMVLNDLGPIEIDIENRRITFLRATCAEPSDKFKITAHGAVQGEIDEPGGRASDGPVRNITRVFYGNP